MGSALPLSALEAQLLKLHADAPGATPTAVRSMVLDLAARRSFAAKGGARRYPTLKPLVMRSLLTGLAARRSFATRGCAPPPHLSQGPKPKHRHAQALPFRLCLPACCMRLAQWLLSGRGMTAYPYTC